MVDYIYKKVKSILFTLISPEEVEKISAAKIVTAELYDKEGYPVDGGLMDIRLGVIDPGLRCKTCGSKLKECMGHFGHIFLARPIVHVLYADTILALLNATCKDCHRVLYEGDLANVLETIDMLDKEKNLEARRKLSKHLVAKAKLSKKCPHCGGKQYKVKIEKPTTYMENDKRLSPIEVRERLSKISDTDLQAMGINSKFARPENMILTLLLIPPVTMRPSITLETGERSEDDLTHKLSDIVRINQRLFENINAGAPEIIVEDLWDLLQYHVTTYYDNTLTHIPPARHRSGQALKTLVERIKSKEGRFRHNLAGKRVNFSARTVISPDPKINFNEVGIPKVVAIELTVPERVTAWNKEWLTGLIKQGPKNYPGANYVIWPDGKKKKITPETVEQITTEIKEGFVVERHLIDGDICVFNRQPSLHRMSIMCHRVRVLPGRSFRLNPSVCVAPDTNVYLSSGIMRKIDELKNCWKESELQTFDWKAKTTRSTELKKFWGLKPEAYGATCYKLTTELGRSIVATGDHPFYTSRGITRLEEIRRGDAVVVRPSETPPYREQSKVLVRSNDILRNRKSYTRHAIKTLEHLKLLPFNLDDQRSMIAARLLGHLFGDGTFILKDHVARLMFRGPQDDLQDIRRDIESLGFKPEKIYVKTTHGEIHTIKGKTLHVVGTGAYFEVRNKPLGLLFKALGAPNGDKIKLSMRVPQWVMRGPLHIKREFLAAYFGCELTKPAVREASKTNFRTLTFKLSKIESKRGAALAFMRDIKRLLRAFGVTISSVTEEPGNIRKDGYRTKSFEADITSNTSMKNLFGKIGYVYNKEKEDIAVTAYQYLCVKEKAIRERLAKYRRVRNLRTKRHTVREIAHTVGMSEAMVDNWIYKNKSAALGATFPAFTEWLSSASSSLPRGLVWEAVTRIEKTYCPFVYDVTTVAETHNFFANGFLTKNCNPYNADFDGDEMNLHIPQTEEARSEAEILMQVQTQIITPKSGYNIIGCVEDSITGNYLLTKEANFPKSEAVNLLTSIGISNVTFDKSTVSGSEVFSSLLPKDFNFIGFNKKGEKSVQIKSGKLILGALDQNTIGEDNGELFREFYRKYGKEKTLWLMNTLSRLGIAMLLKRGFTTTIADTDVPESVKQKVREFLAKTYEDVNVLIEEYTSGKMEALPGKTLRETLEARVLEILNKARNKSGELVAATVSENNPTITMARCGARGNILNFAQMSSCVGQQALGGQRITKGYSERCLPHFKKNDLGPEAHGFVKSAFKSGLNPFEFFFHAMTGRDALMDTALRTPKSGYLYRRLANALQDLKIEYDGTVRNANKNIVQFVYGDDGVDVSKSEGGKISVAKAIADVIGE